jgi:hypothetical protein
MAGVTHFERRDRTKRVHATCRFCGKKIKATPRMLASKEKRDAWRHDWARHLLAHVMEDTQVPLEPSLDPVMAAIYTAYNIEDEYLRNL